MARIKQTTDGKKGGLLYGKSHAENGIKAVITDAGNKEVELEGGEAVVKKSALKDKTVKTITGTNAEILNEINTEAGGNPIYAPSELKEGSDEEFMYGGSISYFGKYFSDKNYRWKYSFEEIPRKAYSPSGIKLGDLIEHEELFRLYPKMKNVKVSIRNDEGSGNLASAETTHNLSDYSLSKIKLPINTINGKEEFKLGEKHSEYSKEATLLHEIQHLCQQANSRSIGRGNKEVLRQSLEKRANLDTRWAEYLGQKDYKAQISEQEAMIAVKKWLEEIGYEYTDEFNFINPIHLEDRDYKKSMAKGGLIADDCLSLPKNTDEERRFFAECILSGFDYKYSGNSHSDYGHSMYFTIGDVKVRFSDHHVTNTSRVFDEAHFKWNDKRPQIEQSLLRLKYLLGDKNVEYKKIKLEQPSGRIMEVFGYEYKNNSHSEMAKGGNITPSAISKMTKAEQKAFYKTKEGKALDKETYSKWKSLVNMSKGELDSFYNSKEGKEAGLSAKEAKAEGIDSGRESARWIMKMKDIPYTEWTSNMWIWAKKQISFVSRMKGMRGDLYDDKGNKTRKHLALLIWGHNPKKMAEGGVIPQQGTLFTKDKKNKLDYRKVGNDYVFKVYDVETNPVENYTRNQSKKRNDDEAVMDYNQFINYLYSELYIDDKKMAEGGNVGDAYSKAISASSRFKPRETIVFDKPIVGKNGNKLISYQWAYEWTMLPNREGELKDKRISNWEDAEISAETGRDIVHKFTVEKKDGDVVTVSSETIPSLLGYIDVKEMKNLPSLVSSVKTLAKQKMQLAILKAQEEEYNNIKNQVDEMPLPEIEKKQYLSGVSKSLVTKWVAAGLDDAYQLDYENKSDISERDKESLISTWKQEMIKKMGGKQPRGIYDLEKRIKRQEKKVQDATSLDKMAEGGNIDDNFEENEYMMNEEIIFEEGGVVPSDKTPEQMAKEFLNNLSQDAIEELKSKLREALSELVVREKNALDVINADIADLEAKKEALREDRSSDALRKRSDYYNAIRQKQKGLIHQTNRYYAVKNGGTLSTFTDKKGLEHESIPDFTAIGSENISFDEENILTQQAPEYIPIINEDEFRIKGYMFDAIRYSSDVYILAVNGYRETGMRGFEVTNEHPIDSEQGYVFVTLDQLVLINDYYYTKAKATERKKAEETNKRTEESYDRIPRERRESHYAQKYFYESMPVSVKKKVTKDAWEALTLEGKEAIYKPIKMVQGKRLVSKLEDDKMWASFHNMYERFLNPEAKVKIDGRNRWGHPEVFEYWYAFRDMMKWKLKDIKFQRQFLSDIRKTALETSFGMSNTNESLYDKFGILVKRQNGSNIKPLEIEQIKGSWINVNKIYGGLVSLAKEEAMKISHTGTTLVFASKAAGVYIPNMKTIAVSAKYGDEMFENILAHEVAHWIDNKIGEQKRLRWATDNYEDTAGIIASTFRKRMNQPSDSDYINATKECFARALEQHFAISVFGEAASVFPDPLKPDLSTSYFESPNYVNKTVYENTMKPLITKFFEENKDFFKYGIEASDIVGENDKKAEPVITPNEVKTEVAVETEEDRIRKEFEDLAKADTMTAEQKANIEKMADSLAASLKRKKKDALKEIENISSEEKTDEVSKENLLVSLEGARVAVEFLEGQTKQDMIDYIEGLETLIEIL